MFHITYYVHRLLQAPQLKDRNVDMKLRRATLSEDAYGAVRTLLLDGARFRPGDKLSIEELSRELGVSRSPVWSAIARLEAEGLVEIAPRKGVYLIGFEPEKLRALFEVREALEGMAASLAASRMTDAEIDAAAACVEQQREALKTRRVEDYSAATLAYHNAIIAGSRNAIIARQLSSIYDQVHAICGGRKAKIGWAGRRLNVEDHAELVAALRRRDAQAAERSARSHAQRLAGGVLSDIATAAVTAPSSVQP
jgi:DNA-binding GntR family transcriptional regulator